MQHFSQQKTNSKRTTSDFLQSAVLLLFLWVWRIFACVFHVNANSALLAIAYKRHVYSIVVYFSFIVYQKSIPNVLIKAHLMDLFFRQKITANNIYAYKVFYSLFINLGRKLIIFWTKTIMEPSVPNVFSVFFVWAKYGICFCIRAFINGIPWLLLTVFSLINNA